VGLRAGNGSGWASSPVIPVDAFIGLQVSYRSMYHSADTHLRAEKSVLVALSIVYMCICYMYRLMKR
jgi:hypothetical protein